MKMLSLYLKDKSQIEDLKKAIREFNANPNSTLPKDSDHIGIDTKNYRICIWAY
jgi:hypothetical protein